MSEQIINCYSTTKSPRPGIIFGPTSALKVISAEVDNEFLDHYGLLPNNGISFDPENEKHQKLSNLLNFKDEKIGQPAAADNLNITITPGGATYNSLRAVQWMLGKYMYPKSVIMDGTVGKDEDAEYLKREAEEMGIDWQLKEHKTLNQVRLKL